MFRGLRKANHNIMQIDGSFAAPLYRATRTQITAFRSNIALADME